MSNLLQLQSELAHQPVVNGTNNKVHVGSSCRINVPIEITGHGNTVEIADGVYVGGGWFGIRADNARIIIGERTTIGTATISAHEGQSVVIGSDCMLSVEIFMDVSDMHPIFDLETGCGSILPPIS